MIYLGHLLWKHLRQYPGRTLAAFAVLTIAASLMLALAGAGAALRFRVGAHLARLFPEEQVWLEATRGALGPIALEGRPITDRTIETLRVRPEVDKIWAVEPIRFPIAVTGNLFGQEIQSDAVIHGVPRELIADALRPGQPWAAPTRPGDPLPIVASRYFLDLYNLGLARASGLPLLSPDSVVGRHATLLLGASIVLGQAPATSQTETVRVVVVGLTAQPGMIGLALPAEVVRDLNRRFAPKSPLQYVKLAVRLHKGADRGAFLRAASGEGLAVSGGDVLGDRVKRAVGLTGAALATLAVAVFALGLLTFYTLFSMTFHARRLDLVRLRALGLSPGQAVALALGEVGIIAASAIALAAVLNALLGVWAARQVQTITELAAWLPPGVLAPAPGWLALAALGILLVALAPTLPTLRWVARVEPAQVIRDL